jgi:hypothetical protein
VFGWPDLAGTADANTCTHLPKWSHIIKLFVKIIKRGDFEGREKGGRIGGYMPQERQLRNETPENPDDEEMVKFGRFISENNYTSDQMREAYYRLMGVSENEENDPGIDKILAKMRELEADGFPVNRFAKLVGSKHDFENALPLFSEYVGNLNISGKEKEMLVSIVEKERNGEVFCFVDGKIFAEIKIKTKELGKEIAVAMLSKSLEEIAKRIPKGKQYEFTFSEE